MNIIKFKVDKCMLQNWKQLREAGYKPVGITHKDGDGFFWFVFSKAN